MGTGIDNKKQGGGYLRSNIAKRTTSLIAAGMIATGSAAVGVLPTKAQAVGSQVPAFQKEFQIDPESAKVSYFDSSGTEKRDFKDGESFTAKIEFAIPDTAKAGDYATAPVINRIGPFGANGAIGGKKLADVGELRVSTVNANFYQTLQHPVIPCNHERAKICKSR